MNPRTGDIVSLADLDGEEALKRGLVPIPSEEVERVLAMSQEEKLAWAREQFVKTGLSGGATLVQPVGALLDRGLARRAERNRAKRERRARRAT